MQCIRERRAASLAVLPVARHHAQLMSDYLGQGRVARLRLPLCEAKHVKIKVERQCSTHAPKPTPPESRRQDGVPAIFASCMGARWRSCCRPAVPGYHERVTRNEA